MEHVKSFDPTEASFEVWLRRLENRFQLLKVEDENKKGWLLDRGGPAVELRTESLAADATYADVKTHLLQAFSDDGGEFQAKIQWDNLKQDGRRFIDLALEGRVLAKKAGYPPEARNALVLSLLNRLVREAHPFVASLLDEKKITDPEEFAREADKKMAVFKHMTMAPAPKVNLVGAAATEENVEEEEEKSTAVKVAWNQHEGRNTPRRGGGGRRGGGARYQSYGPRFQGPHQQEEGGRNWWYRCYRCEEEGHFARDCPYQEAFREVVKRKKGEKDGGSAPGAPPLNG